jgi:hypothetical protein
LGDIEDQENEGRSVFQIIMMSGRRRNVMIDVLAILIGLEERGLTERMGGGVDMWRMTSSWKTRGA